MRMRVLGTIFICLVIAVLGWTTGKAEEEEEVSAIILKAATALVPEHPNSKGVTRFAELVEERTNGRVKVQTYFGGELGSIPQLVDSVKNGVIDVCVANPGVLSQYWRPIQMFDFRYLYANVDNMLEVVNGPIGEEIATKFYEKTDMKIMNFHGGAERNFITSKRPIKSINDFKGLKIRSVEADYSIKWLNALGAVPEVVPFTEVYTALQSGVVDGAENEFLVFDRNKWAEVCKYVALTKHNYTVRFLIMGGPRFRQLPDDIQSVVVTAAKEAGEYAIAEQVKLEDEKKQELIAKYGIEYTKPDLRAFLNISEKVTEEYVDAIAMQEIYKKMLEIREKYIE